MDNNDTKKQEQLLYIPAGQLIVNHDRTNKILPKLGIKEQWNEATVDYCFHYFKAYVCRIPQSFLHKLEGHNLNLRPNSEIRRAYLIKPHPTASNDCRCKTQNGGYHFCEYEELFEFGAHCDGFDPAKQIMIIFD
jgi:hypothetical protein